MKSESEIRGMLKIKETALGRASSYTGGLRLREQIETLKSFDQNGVSLFRAYVTNYSTHIFSIWYS